MDKKEIEIVLPGRQAGGKKVVYRVTGNGETVILVHGFGELADVWKNQVEFLESKFRVIIPDLPGSGDSDSATDMSIEGLAGPIKIILDEEKITKCIMIGHSMGGYITLAFAEKYPHYLKALGLFHSTAFADSEEKKATRRKGIEFINQHGAFEFLKSTTPNLFSPLTHNGNPALIDEQIKTLDNFSASALVSYYEAMIQRPDRTAILRNSTIPVLFIAGQWDNAVPLPDILKQCHLPSLSYIHILENSGHLGMLEEPKKANLILEGFFNESGIT